MTDSELIRRSCEQAEQFRPIFERHFAAIWSYLRRRVGAGVADELASEVFTIAFSRRARYQPQGDSALPWLYGISGKLIARYHRRETRRLRAYARAGALPAEEDDVESLLGKLAAAARGRELAAALADLRQEDRETFLLSALAGLTHSEVAEALAIAEGTVGARLHRTRASLAAALAIPKDTVSP
jgi:RNA polymerase sigma-70 factor (ECF subfamily)